MTRDAPEIHPIHVQPDRLLANFERIALFLWNGRIFSLAIPTPIAQATCLCLPVFPLFRVSTAVGTCAHVPYFTSPLSSRHSLRSACMSSKQQRTNSADYAEE